MKRGFRYLFNQEKTNNKDDSDDMGVEQKRGFFQKFFRPPSSRSLADDEGTSTDPERRLLLHDDDGYAVIDRQQQQHELVISVDKEKREMSAPVSPKSVTFEDELFTTTTTISGRRGQSLAPPPTFLTTPTGTTIPSQQAFINFNYDVSPISRMNSRNDLPKSNLPDREHFSPTRSSRDASLALDEATHDLLRLSSQPPDIWYSSSSRPLHASDRIPKSASTTSMNKVIRAKDGGMMKLLNAFSWDSDRLSDLGATDTSAYTDEEGRRHQTVTVYTNQKRQGPPIIRTTVEGKLKMEKVVGADLISVEHCTCSAWTIHDTITHYKVKTTLGNRTLIMEDESTNDKNCDGSFKMSFYENDQLKTRDNADFQIPSNVDKAKYLSLLSQRLLHDMEMLNQHDEKKTTTTAKTRVEVEVIENVTKILKTYIIGQRNDFLQDFSIDQTTINTTDDELSHSNYKHEMISLSENFDETKMLKNEAIINQSSSDIKFLVEGHQYKGHSEIRRRRPYQRTNSDVTTTSESLNDKYILLPSIYTNLECNLKRMEDHSFIEVNVAVPNVFSAVLSLIRERIISQLPNLVKYGIEQHGKQYSGETTIRRIQHFDSIESIDEKMIINNQKEPSFLFEKPQIIEPVKIPVLNITELDLRRMADTSAILANFAIPRIDYNQLNIEKSYEFHEAKGSSYGMQQKGQYFEGEMILKKKRQILLESESASDDEITSCGSTYLNLMKQEARGEFEVAIIISNDQRSSPKHFQQSQPIEFINLITQVSTDGKKEEVVATLATRIISKEIFIIQEMSAVISNAIITIQKSINLDDIFQHNICCWNDKIIHREFAKFLASSEEEAQIYLKFISSAIACQNVCCIRAIPNLLHITFTADQIDQWTIVPEEMNVQECMNLQSISESFITQQSTILESNRNSFLEISPSIRSNRTENTYAKYPETEHENEVLAIGWNKVIRRASTEKLIPIGKTQTEKLSTIAITEQNVEFSGMIGKMDDHFDSIELKRSLKISTTDEKQLMIASESREYSLLKKSSAQECGSVMRDLGIIQISAHIMEYGVAQTVITGFFAKLEQKKIAEKVEVQLATSIKLKSYFDTKFANFESVLLDIQLKCNCNAESAESFISIAQKPIVKFIVNLKGTLMSVLKTQAEHISSVGRVFPDDKRERTSVCIHEFDNEHQQYMAQWDMIQNALSAEVCVELKKITCNVDAIKQENIQINKQIGKPEFIDAACSEINETYMMIFDKQSQQQSLKIIQNDINREWILDEQKYVAQNEVTKFVDAIWSTIVNDSNIAINICEFNREQITLNTKASEEICLECKQMLYMKSVDENAFAHFHTNTAVSGGERQFKIECKMNESILARQQEELFAESVQQKAILHAENLTEFIAESTAVQADAGILLIRRSATQTTESASHIIGIILTLTQHFEAQHAQEITNEANVEFSIPASNLEVEDNICKSVINRSVVNLETNYAKAIALQENVELINSRKVLAETESILKGMHTDSVREKMRETNSEGFEILSQWTTVDRDLEAEVSLKHKHNIVSKLSTIAIIEEEISIDEKWIATECNLEICKSRNIIVNEHCQCNLQIEFNELTIELKNYEKKENYEILWNDKNYDTLDVNVYETILEKLNAMINLHRVSNILPKQSANEYICRDQQFLVALPLYVKCDENKDKTNYTILEICLKQNEVEEYIETIQTMANWMKMEIFECEQAENEKFHMDVKLQGKQLLASLEVELVWPEIRKGDKMAIDMIEYVEEQITIYAQIACKQISFDEFNKTIIISQKSEPQMLMTSTTKEEIVNGYDEFRIVPQEKATTFVIIIGNKGECLSVWLQEAKQNFITMGFQYNEESEIYETEGNFTEKRFGGNYQLITKATRIEDSNASMIMSHRIANEAINKVFKECAKKFATMDMLAATSKVILVDINRTKAPQMPQIATIQYYCSRRGEPIKRYFREINEIIHTVHAQFKIKEASLKFAIAWSVPNYGGHFILNTEAAEEAFISRQIEYQKAEAFESAAKMLKQMITPIIVPVLSVQSITEVMEEIRKDLIRLSFIDEAFLLLKEANKGINIEVKLIETTDIRQISYLQFKREIEAIEVETIIKEKRFGGKLNLTMNASEEYEINAKRELTNNLIRIAHCNQLIACKNSYPSPISYQFINIKSDSTVVQINLQKMESVDNINWIFYQKLLMKKLMMMQECETIALTVNLNYLKESSMEISEIIVQLARNIEPTILITFATTNEQKLVQWILEKRRDAFMNVSTTIIAKNNLKIIPINIIESKLMEITICANIQRIAEVIEVCQRMIAANRGDNMHWKLREINVENECSNYQFKQENLMEEIEGIYFQSNYAGHFIFNTFAINECNINMSQQLESKLITDAKKSLTINICNNGIPIAFTTKSAISLECNEEIALKRQLQMANVTITRQLANIDLAEIIVKEIILQTENIIVKYQHKDEHEEIEMIKFVAFYGGKQKLKTLAVSTITANINEELICKHLMHADVYLQQIIANIAKPCKLTVQSSAFNEINQNCHLQWKGIFENEKIIISTLHTANYEFAKIRIRECTNEIEMITTYWQRNEMYENAQLCICDKYFGGNLIFTTNYAQETLIMFTASLIASRFNLENVILIIRTARHSTESPILTTKAITDLSIQFNYHFNCCSSTDQQTMIIAHIANQIEPIIAQLTESTSITEIINVQYQRQNQLIDAFSEVLPEARFGGSLILNTLAAKEVFISIEIVYNNRALKQFETEMIFMDKNRAIEMCQLLAATEYIITTNVQLQRSNDLSNVELMRYTSRKGDKQCCTFNESTEINLFNNFLWKKPEEISANQVAILKEIRYGGHLELSTKYANEEAITIMETLKQTMTQLSATITRKIANDGEAISINCLASQENHWNIHMELQSNKLAQLETLVIRKVANCVTPQELFTNEFSEMMLTTNVTMQKLLDNELAQIAWKAKKSR